MVALEKIKAPTQEAFTDYFISFVVCFEPLRASCITIIVSWDRMFMKTWKTIYRCIIAMFLYCVQMRIYLWDIMDISINIF